MKAMLLTVALLTVSTLASAGLVGEFPKVQFGSTFVSVEGICVSADGNTVQTLSPVEVCVKRSMKNHGYCDKFEDQVLTTSVHYTKEIPVGNHKMGTTEETIATDYSIPYGTVGGRGGFHVVKYVDFSLPVCE